jgi:predicted RNase H-like HicB family nuclease
MSLRYQIVLHKSEEGYAVNCPALPGCWSQGETEQEAMQNIRDAIEDYLAAVKESVRGSDVRQARVGFLRKSFLTRRAKSRLQIASERVVLCRILRASAWDRIVPLTECQ